MLLGMSGFFTGNLLREFGGPRSCLSAPYVRRNSHGKTTLKSTTKHNTFRRFTSQKAMLEDPEYYTHCLLLHSLFSLMACIIWSLYCSVSRKQIPFRRHKYSPQTVIETALTLGSLAISIYLVFGVDLTGHLILDSSGFAYWPGNNA